ncbi:MAG: Uma2 family endonuclease [Cyanobacteria bacterium P01_F01_bin.150]
MLQATPKSLTFAEFLEQDHPDGILYDLLADGSLVAVPSEAEINSAIVMILLEYLMAYIQLRLAKVSVLELEVIPTGDNKRNRRPDLAILEPAHLTIDSLTSCTALFLGALPPRFVVEVVSPGNTDSENYQRDYIWKRQQYQDWGIPEYWIIDPHRTQVNVLFLVNGSYQSKTYQGPTPIHSLEFPELQITATQLFADVESLT